MLFAWINAEGQWLVLDEVQGHLGVVQTPRFTTDINEASATGWLPRCAAHLSLTPIPVEVKRVVRIVPRG